MDTSRSSTGLFGQTGRRDRTTISASAKGGLVFHPSESAHFIAGCGYQVEGQKENENGSSSGSNSNSELLTNVIMASAGAEFTLGNVTLGAAALYGRIVSNGRYWRAQEGFKVRYAGTAFKIAGGASVSF